jgi:hypothetical protein
VLETYCYGLVVLFIGLGNVLGFLKSVLSLHMALAGKLYVASGNFNVTCYTQATAIVTPIIPTPTPTPNFHIASTTC